MMRSINSLMLLAKAGRLILGFGILISILICTQQQSFSFTYQYFKANEALGAKVFLQSKSPAASVESFAEYLRGLQFIKSVNIISAEQGAKYLKDEIIKTDKPIDSEGIPIRVDLTFKGELKPKVQREFEQNLKMFNFVELMLIDASTDQSQIMHLLWVLNICAVLGFFLLMNRIYQNDSVSEPLLQEWLVQMELGFSSRAIAFNYAAALTFLGCLMLLVIFLGLLPISRYLELGELPALAGFAPLIISGFWYARLFAKLDKMAKVVYN